jgi:hypothetical protein
MCTFCITDTKMLKGHNFHCALFRAERIIVVRRKPEYPGENRQPATSHRPHNVVSGTPCLSGIRTRNVSGNIQSLQLLYVHDHDNPSLKFVVCGYFNIRKLTSTIYLKYCWKWR